MRKKLLVVMMLVMVFHTNLFAYKKAEAAATGTATQSEAVYVGVMVGATAVTAAALHAQKWYEDKADDVAELAKQSWEYMSTDGKAAFLSTVDAYKNGWEVSADLLSDWFSTLGKEYPVVTNLNSKYNDSIGNLQYSDIDLNIMPSGQFQFFYNGVVQDYFDIYLKNNGTQSFIDLRNGNRVFIGVIANGKYGSISNLMNGIYDNNFNFGYVKKYITALGLSFPITLGLNNELVNDDLTLDGVDFANNWAKNLLNQGDATKSTPFYVNPTATTTAAGTVYNPADTKIIDVGGVSVPVTQTPTGDWVNTGTGEVVIPAEIDTPVETTPGTETPNAKDEKDKLEKESKKLAPMLTTRFPFSLPWDFLALIKLLYAEPMTPHWEVEGTDKIPFDINLSLAFFDKYAPWFRGFVLMGFIMSTIFMHGRFMGGSQ